MSPDGKQPTVVFAGGGHAHLYSLRRTRELMERGFEVVLVSPGRFLYYSGMAPALLSRTYRPEETRIDVRYLVEKGGGRFIEDRVKELWPKNREVVLEGGASLHYDAMSVCLGSGVPVVDSDVAKNRLVPVKPVENLESLRRKLRSPLGDESGHERNLLIVGGGPAGCEVACNARRIFEERGIKGRIAIVEAGDALLGPAPRRARIKMRTESILATIVAGMAALWTLRFLL